MRNLLAAFLVFCSTYVLSQTSPSAAKPAPKKPATATAPAKPTAIIDTTAGKMTCTLFPDKAPIGVSNFIGLS
ncbi:MAG TPA: hypothetical protein VFA15_00475, partial [Nitrososphaera sp.]|nr:hypothetical protein [Nitrososphaera sp.]